MHAIHQWKQEWTPFWKCDYFFSFIPLFHTLHAWPSKRVRKTLQRKRKRNQIKVTSGGSVQESNNSNSGRKKIKKWIVHRFWEDRCRMITILRRSCAKDRLRMLDILYRFSDDRCRMLIILRQSLVHNRLRIVIILYRSSHNWCRMFNILRRSFTTVVEKVSPFYIVCYDYGWKSM